MNRNRTKAENPVLWKIANEQGAALAICRSSCCFRRTAGLIVIGRHVERKDAGLQRKKGVETENQINALYVGIGIICLPVHSHKVYYRYVIDSSKSYNTGSKINENIVTVYRYTL